MVFGWCFGGSNMEEPQSEYDELPYGLKWRMHFGKLEQDPHTGNDIMRLSNNRLVQTHCESTEYQALRLVDKHTSIPAYRVIAVYNRPEGKVVEYEGIPGTSLDTCWKDLSIDKKRRIISDLGRFTDQLRKITAPKHFVIGDSTMGAARDTRFGPGMVGPFYTLDAFHDFLRRGHRPQEFRGDYVEKVHEHRPKSDKPYELKFSHANLSPRNILIDDSGRVCALIGWESAGWYPEYWEYVQMCQNIDPNSLASEEWLSMMKGVMTKYDEELECDRALRTRFRSEDYARPRSVRPMSPSPSVLADEQRETDDKNTENTSG
ncbi:hypothetical protein LTS08_007908 [Lithohypha guttulata]|uniref:Aminoglycoside phosphotransferase domain-containing protein n=1 Tax=Lithohypha guttulata TaxID=1690604 RepID=A0AAN7ST77_9EURO|nr:hypothetical protein LTR51_007931 [Lithohypha guttulata]KAK5080546.1 hypothetical protein LTR05_008489 [Lithohypha guttulata]KAK5095774.1 hypothetical protein LTS08_007908 [Lithohypha guttulata]